MLSPHENVGKTGWIPDSGGMGVRRRNGFIRPPRRLRPLPGGDLHSSGGNRTAAAEFHRRQLQHSGSPAARRLLLEKSADRRKTALLRSGGAAGEFQLLPDAFRAECAAQRRPFQPPPPPAEAGQLGAGDTFALSSDRSGGGIFRRRGVAGEPGGLQGSSSGADRTELPETRLLHHSPRRGDSGGLRRSAAEPAETVRRVTRSSPAGTSICSPPRRSLPNFWRRPVYRAPRWSSASAAGRRSTTFSTARVRNFRSGRSAASC